MRWIVGACLQFRLLVPASIAVFRFFGITQLRDTPVDMLPKFSRPRPYVEVQTEALGLSAAEVEAFAKYHIVSSLCLKHCFVYRQNARGKTKKVWMIGEKANVILSFLFVPLFVGGNLQ